MDNKDFIVWVFLVALTIIGYLSSTHVVGEKTLVLVLLVIGAVKFFGVGFQFMDLKKAHFFWKSGLVVSFLLFAVVALVWG